MEIFKWTDERLARLRKLWLEGVPSPKIAAALKYDDYEGGGVRSKARQIGLPPRRTADESDWLPADEQLLSALWLDGTSTRQIAEQLEGDHSSDAIKMKAQRMKLPLRHPPPIKVQSPTQGVIPFTPVQLQQRVRGVTLMELRDCHCRFVLDEVDDGERLFCGRARSKSSTFFYCEGHLDRVVKSRAAQFKQAAE